MWLGLLEIGLTLVDIMVRLDGMVCSRIRLPRVGGYLGQARWGGGYQGHTGHGCVQHSKAGWDGGHQDQTASGSDCIRVRVARVVDKSK